MTEAAFVTEEGYLDFAREEDMSNSIVAEPVNGSHGAPVANAGRAAARDLLAGRDMICFSHDWTGDPLSKTHLMRLLARKNRILWVNSIGYRTPTVSKADV